MNIYEKHPVEQTVKQSALAEWLRRVPAKYMGFPRESSNLSGDVFARLAVLFSLNMVWLVHIRFWPTVVLSSGNKPS